MKDKRQIFSIVAWVEDDGVFNCKAESRIRGDEEAIMVINYLAKNMHTLTEEILKEHGAIQGDEGTKFFTSEKDMDGV